MWLPKRFGSAGRPPHRRTTHCSRRTKVSANNQTCLLTQPESKKIPAGCPAGEGGMVEEIYIHYYRHLVREKVTPFWKKNARNCSGGVLAVRRHKIGLTV